MLGSVQVLSQEVYMGRVITLPKDVPVYKQLGSSLIPSEEVLPKGTQVEISAIRGMNWHQGGSKQTAPIHSSRLTKFMLIEDIGLPELR